MGHPGLLLLLVPFILLWTTQEPEMAEGSSFSQCPKSRGECDLEEIDHCNKKKRCPRGLKCCYYSCGMKCVNIKVDSCTLPIIIGPCYAYIPRWGYNPKTRRCVEFIYGGCLGNTNSFQTKKACVLTCWRKRKPRRG